MDFSVVIPTFNRAPLLAAALESVFAQEFPAREVIVIDDGSTDGTLESLARFGARVTVLRQANRGPAAARNAGLAQARGEYVAFLDSDDLWFPWTLATYRRAIEAHGGPAMVSGSQVDFEHDAPAVAAAEYRATAFADYLATASRNVWIGTCGVAIKTSALRAVGGFADHAFNAEDSDLWLRLGTQPGFVQIAAPPVFAYRRHAASAVAAVDRTARGVAEIVAAEKRGAYPGGPARRGERRKIITRHARPASLACLRAGQRAAAWQLYGATWRWQLRLGHGKYLCAFPALAILPRTTP